MTDETTCPRCADLARVRGVLDPLDRLREPEGASVEILCPNPGDDGPRQAIYVRAPWTSWRPRRFEGESVAACLAAAEGAREGGDDNGSKVSWGEPSCRYYSHCPDKKTLATCNEQCPTYRRTGMSQPQEGEQRC